MAAKTYLLAHLLMLGTSVLVYNLPKLLNTTDNPDVIQKELMDLGGKTDAQLRALGFSDEQILAIRRWYNELVGIEGEPSLSAPEYTSPYGPQEDSLAYLTRLRSYLTSLGYDSSEIDEIVSGVMSGTIDVESLGSDVNVDAGDDLSALEYSEALELHYATDVSSILVEQQDVTTEQLSDRLLGAFLDPQQIDSTYGVLEEPSEPLSPYGEEIPKADYRGYPRSSRSVREAGYLDDSENVGDSMSYGYRRNYSSGYGQRRPWSPGFKAGYYAGKRSAGRSSYGRGYARRY